MSTLFTDNKLLSIQYKIIQIQIDTNTQLLKFKQCTIFVADTLALLIYHFHSQPFTLHSSLEEQLFFQPFILTQG